MKSPIIKKKKKKKIIIIVHAFYQQFAYTHIHTYIYIRKQKVPTRSWRVEPNVNQNKRIVCFHEIIDCPFNSRDAVLVSIKCNNYHIGESIR